MSLLEKDLYGKFGKIIRDKWKRGSSAFELKLVRGNTFNFNLLEVHQERALKMASSPSGVYYKIADVGMGAKPFDCFFMNKVGAYVVLVFCDNPTAFYFIDIYDYISFKSKNPTKKSLTLSDVKQLSFVISP
jgi:hypothetical protein